MKSCPPQIAIQPLRDGTDLRDNVQTALAEFKETCGLSPIANIKQCIRLLATRVSSSSDQGTLNLYMNGEVRYDYLRFLCHLCLLLGKFWRSELKKFTLSLLCDK